MKVIRYVMVPGELPETDRMVYYVDGFRRFMGTVKFHLFPECHVLQNHKPGHGEGQGYILATNMQKHQLTTNVCKYCRLKESKLSRALNQ